MGVGKFKDNPRTADVAPVFWDTSNLGWVSLSKDNPRIAGVTLIAMLEISGIQYVHATTGHVWVITLHVVGW